MGCCEGCLKFILFITNFIVMLAGTVLLVAGGIFYAKNFDFFPELEQYSNNVNAVLIPMMVVGGILFLVGMVGCCGACSGKSGLLNFYFAILLIAVLLEIVVLILGVVYKDEFIEETLDAAKTLFEGYKEKYDGQSTAISDTEALAVNAGQSLFHCCGLKNGPTWWKNADTKYPPGCCSDWNGADIPDSGFVTCDDGKLYDEGCTEKVTNLTDDFGYVIIIIIVLVIVFQILCLFAACYSKKKELVA